MTNFKLRIEIEDIVEKDYDETNDQSKVWIQLEDDREYELIVWTFQFFHTMLKKESTLLNGETPFYLVPPDLFVKELTRPCLEKSITEILDSGDIELTLNKSAYKI